MNLDLSVLINGVDEVYPFDGEILDYDLEGLAEGIRIFGPIKYEGKIFKLEGINTIDIDILYRYKTKCDRCLEPIIKEVKTSLSGRLEENSKPHIEDENSEYEDIIYYNKGFLKLDDYILMEVASSLPMKSLCSIDCKGLCPHCGIDLNKKSCGCLDRYIDPRLEKLKEFVVDD